MAEPRGLLDDFFENIFGRDETLKMDGWNCVNKSIYDAKTYEAMTGMTVKIAVSKILKDKDNDVDHAQAIGMDGDSMIPLTSHNEDGKVRKWNWHYPDKEPYRYIEVDEFIKEQKQNLKPELLKYLQGLKK